MIKVTSIVCGAVLATATVFGALASTANAAPLGVVLQGVTEEGPALDVNYRRGRYHCHWRSGRKVCHGASSRRNGPRYGYNNNYRRSPGITLRFGFGDRGYRNRRWR